MRKRIVFVLLLAALCAALLFFFFRSPHYALKQTAEDIRTSGLAGLRPHLTEQAAETLDVVALLEAHTGLGKKAMALLGEERVEEHLSEIEWNLEDVAQQGDDARATVGFAVADLFSGMLDLSMVRSDGAWKIQGVSLSRLSVAFSE